MRLSIDFEANSRPIGCQITGVLLCAAIRATTHLQFERACKEVLKEDHQLTSEGEEQEFDDVQLLLYSSQQFGPSSMRQLTSNRVSKLVQLSGIITSASKPKVTMQFCAVLGCASAIK